MLRELLAGPPLAGRDGAGVAKAYAGAFWPKAQSDKNETTPPD